MRSANLLDENGVSLRFFIWRRVVCIGTCGTMQHLTAFVERTLSFIRHCSWSKTEWSFSEVFHLAASCLHWYLRNCAAFDSFRRKEA